MERKRKEEIRNNDEKIQSLIEWRTKYPKIAIVGSEKITEERKKELIELSKEYKVDYRKIIEEYAQVRKDYREILSDNNKGNLSEEQISKCREANISKKLGYSDEVREMSEKYNTREERIVDIINEYGSIPNFIQEFRQGNLSQEEYEKHRMRFSIMDKYNRIIKEYWQGNLSQEDYEKYQSIISQLDISKTRPNLKQDNLEVNTIINTNGELSRGENQFIKSILIGCAPNDILVYSKEDIDTIISKLPEQERKFISCRYGLSGSGKQTIYGTLAMTIEEMRDEFEMSSEEVVFNERNILKKIINSNVDLNSRFMPFEALLNSEFVTEEEKQQLAQLQDDIWNNGIMFAKDYSESDFDFSKLEIIKEVQEKVNARQREAGVPESYNLESLQLSQEIENFDIDKHEEYIFEGVFEDVFEDVEYHKDDGQNKQVRTEFEEMTSNPEDWAYYDETYNPEDPNLQAVLQRREELLAYLEKIRGEVSCAEELLAEYNRLIGNTEKTNNENDTKDTPNMDE